MRFLMLFLPNIYDILTLLVIGYAYFVDKETPLKIPFLFACIVIYLATRLGIFAGQIIGMLSGQVSAEPADINDADAFAKRILWGFVPQLIGVILFQVLMAFCYLPGLFNNQKTSQSQQQVQIYDKNSEAELKEEKDVVSVQSNEAASAVVAEPEDATVTKEKQTQAAQATQKTTENMLPAVTKSRYVKPVRINNTKNINNTHFVTNTENTVKYDIPAKTLKVAGVEQKEISLTNVKQTGTSSFGGNNISSGQNVNQDVKTNSGSSVNPKRYPGDDNPINTSWGYYRTGVWAEDAARTLKNK